MGRVRTCSALALATALVVVFNNCSPLSTNEFGLAQSDSPVNLASTNSFAQLKLGASPFSTKEEEYAAGRILVKARSGISDTDFTEELARYGGRSIQKISGINVHIVELPAHLNEKATAALLAHNPKFEFAEVDRIVRPEAITNDPLLGNQYAVTKLQADLAWDSTIGSSQTIAVCDTGVFGAHQDLAAIMVPGWNFYDNNSDTSDVHGHGTLVSGTAAAIGNNGVGMAGIAPGARIMPLRVTDTTGAGYWSMMSQAVVWAADRGVRVANISFANLPCSSTIQSAGNYIISKGGLLVVSASNYNTDIGCPDNNLIVASATDSGDKRASFSNYGVAVDVAAPGVGVTCTNRSGGYGSCSGTSFSSPITAAVIALMMDVNPDLSPAQYTSILRDTAEDLGDPGFDIYFGYGRVNAARAVAAAAVAVPQINDTKAPSVGILSPSNNSKVSGVATIDVSATDNVGVTRVDLYVGGVLTDSDSTAPFSFALDTTQRAEGPLSLQAKAVDKSGNVGTSSNVTVVVDNIPDPVDDQAPVVTIAQPTDGAVIGGRGKGSVSNLSVVASASDNVGVTSMTVWVDGEVKGTSTSSSVSVTVSGKKLSSGAHTVTVEAIDAAGNSSRKTVSVTKN